MIVWINIYSSSHWLQVFICRRKWPSCWKLFPHALWSEGATASSMYLWIRISSVAVSVLLHARWYTFLSRRLQSSMESVRVGSNFQSWFSCQWLNFFALLEKCEPRMLQWKSTSSEFPSSSFIRVDLSLDLWRRSLPLAERLDTLPIDSFELKP